MQLGDCLGHARPIGVVIDADGKGHIEGAVGEGQAAHRGYAERGLVTQRAEPLLAVSHAFVGNIDAGGLEPQLAEELRVPARPQPDIQRRTIDVSASGKSR